MVKRLADRTVIVTGGGAGIGYAATHRFAEEGANLVVADRDRTAGERVVAEVRDRGIDAIFVATDVALESDVRALVKATVDRFGKLDGAFNNAGVAQSHKPLHEISGAEWQRVIDVDLTGVFWCLKYEIEAMLEHGGGSIVNTASGLGVVAMPIASDYVAAKHGVIGLTRSAALDYAKKGIRVNAIMPGLTMTPIVETAMKDAAYASSFDALIGHHPIGRGAEPREIAEAALWLLSNEASYVTGSALAVDGGYTAH